MSFPASAYAFVPDAERPSTWKLRLFDRPTDIPARPSVRLTAAAAQALSPSGFRGNPVQLPAGSREDVKRKVAAAWLRARRSRGDRVSEENLPVALKGGGKKKDKKSTYSKEAVELVLDEQAGRAFERISGSLPLLLKGLKEVAEDFVSVPPSAPAQDYSLLRAAIDLATVAPQVRDPAIKSQISSLIPEKVFAHAQKLPVNKFEAEAGVHAHGLDRSVGRTLLDGSHTHLFRLPDGSMVVTEEDGWHDHEISEDGNTTGMSRGHRHVVVLPDGTRLQTEEDGEHEHDLLVRFSAIDGTHDHVLKLPGGEEVKSLSAGEFAQRHPQLEAPKSPGPASSFSKRAYQVRLLKAEEEEERTVLGVVLEPETVDSQGDIYSEDEVRKTAWRFMERYQTFGLMHEQVLRSVLPLECFLAPVDFKIAGQSVKKGTWLLRCRVLDDDVWQGVKSGTYTGFSIGGSAIRKPVGDSR